MAVILQYDGKVIQTPTNQNVVLVGGCFDILHFGHIEFLKKAKAAGDYLIVALEPDESIIKYKHRNPTHNQIQRAEILAELRCVDLVILLHSLKGYADYNQLVYNINPKIIAITSDDPQKENKKKQAHEVGATVKIVLPRLGNFSSSSIKNDLSNQKSKQKHSFL
jgi:FAD synthetase